MLHFYESRKYYFISCKPRDSRARGFLFIIAVAMIFICPPCPACMLSHPPAIRALPQSSQPLAANIRPYIRALIRMLLASQRGSTVLCLHKYPAVLLLVLNRRPPFRSLHFSAPYIRARKRRSCRFHLPWRKFTHPHRLAKGGTERGAPFAVFFGCNFSPCRQAEATPVSNITCIADKAERKPL